MNILKYLYLIPFLGISVATAAQAEDIYVISNPGTQLSGGDVREVFLGEKLLAGSVKIIPVDNSAVEEAFLSKVLKMDAPKYNATWTKKAFRDGLTPPVSKSSDAEVVNFVKSTPGAVGYVTTQAAGVTVIQKY